MEFVLGVVLVAVPWTPALLVLASVTPLVVVAAWEQFLGSARELATGSAVVPAQLRMRKAIVQELAMECAAGRVKEPLKVVVRVAALAAVLGLVVLMSKVAALGVVLVAVMLSSKRPDVKVGL